MSNTNLEKVQVGQELPELSLPPVDRTVLALFAGASGDHNPAHIDTDFARKAGMPDVFAQGMLGMAWMTRLLTNWAPQRQLRKVNARFTGITHLGNQITCRGKVVEILDVGGEKCARIEIATSNQYGQVKIAGDALIALK
jgi:acyl dehydratase